MQNYLSLSLLCLVSFVMCFLHLPFFNYYCSLSPLVAFPIPHPPCSYWPCADPSVIRWVRSEGRQMNEEVHGFDLGLSFQVPCRLCPGSTSLCWSSGVSVTLLSLWRQRANDTPFYPCLASRGWRWTAERARQNAGLSWACCGSPTPPGLISVTVTYRGVLFPAVV